MASRFLSGTPLSRMEIEMQLVPGFRPQRSGFVVNQCAYDSLDCECRCCAKGIERIKYACSVCHYLHKRFVAGCVDLNELRRILAAESRKRAFVTRVEALSRRSVGFFHDEAHRRRFEQAMTGGSTTAAAYEAALYLLTARQSLWCVAHSRIRQNTIHFHDIRLCGIEMDGYALFYAAKDLYYNTMHISLSELADPEVISSEVFRLFVYALLICRYGTAIIHTFKEERKC